MYMYKQMPFIQLNRKGGFYRKDVAIDEFGLINAQSEADIPTGIRYIPCNT